MNKKILNLFVICLSILVFSSFSLAQALKRTTYKTENIEFGVGGTVTVIGAPTGSVTIEGWNKNEVEVSAEIEMEAATEADLAELAKVNTFVIDEQFGHIRI